MIRRSNLRLAIALTSALLTIAFGCGEDERRRPTGDPGLRRGSAICHQWQDAFCELAISCGIITPADCERGLQSISCISDQRAGECRDALGAASCATFPQDCDVRAVGDPAPAIDACMTFVRTVCTHDFDCGANTSIDMCVSQTSERIGCPAAIGVTRDYEPCMSEVEVLSCQAGDLPAICDQLFFR